ncbi:hypothetical protein [Glutamicibacter halophytocola]|uniref:hypothetical protein n=1 Tax=Glutamicibacter halophytocola TaxID=1933880 RepID=UPI0015C5282C|nr:hypothetical protein [Glutamicibacter halophytocola]NQD41428.1 hypothetical protein [Glutamicibacter halophytocola]
MGNFADDILANSPVRRMENMLNGNKKIMDRVYGTQRWQKAFISEALRPKYFENLGVKSSIMPSYKTESLVKTFSTSFMQEKSVMTPFLNLNIEGMLPKFNVLEGHANYFAKSMAETVLPMQSMIQRQFENPYKSMAANMTSGWPKHENFVPASIALHAYRPTKQQLEQKALAEVIEKAEQFHKELAPEEVEELEAQAEDFVSQDADAAYLLARSPVFINLSLRKRQVVSQFLAVVIYVTFLAAAIYGIQTGSTGWALAFAMGFPSAKDAAKFGYQKSMYVLEKFASDEE